MLGKIVGTTAIVFFVGFSVTKDLPAPEKPEFVNPFAVFESVAYVAFSEPMIVASDGSLVAEAAQVEVMPAVTDGPDDKLSLVRWVAVDRVNVRGGPSTDFSVLGQVEFADAVLVVADHGDGWAHIRIEGDGIEGFMAGRFLQDVSPL